MADVDATAVAPESTADASTTEAPAEAPQTAKGLGSEGLGLSSMLPKDIASHPHISRYKSVEEMAKGHINQSELIGRSIRIPQSDNPDEWGSVWNKLGRPEAVDGYKEPENLELPEGIELDPSMLKMVRETAHSKGYTQAQYESALQMHAQWLTAVINQAEAKRAQAGMDWEESIAKRFGAQAPRVKAAANAVWEQLGNGMWGEDGAEVLQELAAAGLNTSVKLTVALANMYERMREGQYEHSDTYLDIPGSPADVDKQIADLRAKEQKGRLSPAENKLMDQLYDAKQRHIDSAQRRAALAR